MDQKLWDQLLALATSVDSLATLGSKNGSYTAATIESLTVRYLDKLLTTMLPLSQRGHGNALGFVGSDWLCLTSDDPRYAMTLTDQITSTFKQQFRLLIQSKPNSVVIRKPGDAGQPETRVLWRLRLPDESVPLAVMPAPSLQP